MSECVPLDASFEFKWVRLVAHLEHILRGHMSETAHSALHGVESVTHISLRGEDDGL